MMTMMAPSRRMRTARPPAQMPRMRPISSDLWDTSRGRLLSLHAAGENKEDREAKGQRPPRPGPEHRGPKTGCTNTHGRRPSSASRHCSTAQPGLDLLTTPLSQQPCLHIPSYSSSASLGPPPGSPENWGHPGPWELPSCPPAR